MYKGGRLTICDRLTQIKESIYYIQQWSKEINCADDFLASMDKVMVFNACVMRLQVIGKQVGKLLFLQPSPLSEYKEIRLSGNFWLVSFKISYLCLPLFYETRTTPSCHPSGCAYRQL